MKKVIAAVLVYLGIIVIIYLSVALIADNIDFRNWDQAEKFICLTLFCIAAVITSKAAIEKN